ncbi:hypothetical protein M885DRAFT_508490 [Pelagophyceae sp. CCMP2097]|nr:hypothetical protein M885DRAFT_508490 [Pelagophyceae sp. CCMP2097]
MATGYLASLEFRGENGERVQERFDALWASLRPSVIAKYTALEAPTRTLDDAPTAADDAFAWQPVSIDDLEVVTRRRQVSSEPPSPEAASPQASTESPYFRKAAVSSAPPRAGRRSGAKVVTPSGAKVVTPPKKHRKGKSTAKSAVKKNERAASPSALAPPPAAADGGAVLSTWVSTCSGDMLASLLSSYRAAGEAPSTDDDAPARHAPETQPAAPHLSLDGRACDDDARDDDARDDDACGGVPSSDGDSDGRGGSTTVAADGAARHVASWQPSGVRRRTAAAPCGDPAGPCDAATAAASPPKKRRIFPAAQDSLAHLPRHLSDTRGPIAANCWNALPAPRHTAAAPAPRRAPRPAPAPRWPSATKTPAPKPVVLAIADFHDEDLCDDSDDDEDASLASEDRGSAYYSSDGSLDDWIVADDEAAAALADDDAALAEPGGRAGASSTRWAARGAGLLRELWDRRTTPDAARHRAALLEAAHARARRQAALPAAATAFHATGQWGSRAATQYAGL